MPPKHIAIVGCGYVGSALARQLLAEGHRVIGVRRQADRLPQGVIPVAADLEDYASLKRAMQHVAADVTHLVYATSAGGRTEARYRAAYVDGVAHTLRVLQDANALIERAIFVSSTGVYGQSDGSVVNESSVTAPSHFSGKILRQGEACFHQANFPTITLRLAGIYGPERTRLLREVAEGTAKFPTKAVASNRIHRDDCAGALKHLLLHVENPASIYLGVDSDPSSLQEVMTWLAAQLNVPTPTPSSNTSHDINANTNINTNRRSRSHKRCSNQRLLDSGYTLQYPSYRDGYSELIQALEPESELSSPLASDFF